jgi:nitroreductase
LILDMARYAPTAGNAQPWKFLIIKSEANKTKLREAVRSHLEREIDGMGISKEDKLERKRSFSAFAEKILAAPVLIFVFIDASHYPEPALYDGAMAVQNMMLAAHALGYGTSFQTTIFPEELVKDLLSIPDNYRLICGVPLGKPAAKPKMPNKKELCSFIWEERPLPEG